MKVNFEVSGNFNHIEDFFNRMKNRTLWKQLERFGQEGVDALASATPVDTGLTASSWHYEVSIDDSGVSIYWMNSNVNNGVNIAIILQYGHGTGTGGYVQGQDYINPAIKPVFDKIGDDVWKEVMR